ncbi:MAG: hypothetical protein HY075_01300 [Deltaproteobacteria bacterium]|nr:hypothetical protein [Deltaproteobacteria bacterium]
MTELATDASSELEQMLSELQDATAKKKALRDALSKLKAEEDKLRDALAAAYGLASRLTDVTKKSTQVVTSTLLLTGGSVTMTRVDANAGGKIHYTVNCLPADVSTSGPGPSVSLASLDLMNQRYFHFATHAGGQADFTVDTQGAEPVALQLIVSAPGLQLGELSVCTVTTTYDQFVANAPVALSDEARRLLGAARAQLIAQARDFFSTGLRLRAAETNDPDAVAETTLVLLKGLSMINDTGDLVDAEKLRDDLSGAKDALGGMSQDDMFALQSIQDRRPQFYLNLSSILSKISGTQASIVGNLK